MNANTIERPETMAIPLLKEIHVQKYKRALFMICFFSSLFGGTVSTLMSVYLPVAVKDLMSNTSSAQYDNITAYISALFIFGWMVGGILWGILCDTLGRKKSFIYATLCYGLFTLTTAVAPSWFMVVVSRFMSGFGIGGVLVITTMLVSEGYQEKRRAVLLGILSISIPVGIFSAGLINYFVSYWRYAFVVGAIPVVLSGLAAIFFTESELWRSAQRKGIQARNNLRQLFNNENGKHLVMGSLIFGTALIGLWATFSWLPSWIQSLIQGAGGQKERGLAMMMMGGGGLLGGFVSGWIVNAIGVKKTLLLCFGISFILSVILFKLTTVLSTAVYFQIALITIFFGMSQGALSVYIPDLFPVSLRATATGVCFNLGRFFTAVAVFFIGSLVDFLGGYGNAIFWFSFVFLIGFVITFFSKPAIYAQQSK
ncbi:MAG: MFS transporter [Bacteroidota bacterium]|nr:MFS transporter [Bacteroidota bacterium]